MSNDLPERAAEIAAAPEPPRAPEAQVELPPLPPDGYSAWLQNGEKVNAFPWPAKPFTNPDRDYWKKEGFSNAPLYTADQMHDYAHAALAAPTGELAATLPAKAARVIKAARVAMDDEDCEDKIDFICVPSHRAAALSLALDEFDADRPSQPVEPQEPRDERVAYEEWLLTVHLLTGTWNEQRNCYDEFHCHLAYSAWKARAALERKPAIHYCNG